MIENRQTKLVVSENYLDEFLKLIKTAIFIGVKTKNGNGMTDHLSVSFSLNKETGNLIDPQSGIFLAAKGREKEIVRLYINVDDKCLSGCDSFNLMKNICDDVEIFDIESLKEFGVNFCFEKGPNYLSFMINKPTA